MKKFPAILAKLRTYDWPLILIVFILTLIGFAGIYSVDTSRGGPLQYFPTQFIAFTLGALVLIIASNLHVTFYETTAKIFYLSALILLIAVLFLGESIRGTTGWFRFAGFSFQPAEFAKISAIIYLSYFIYKQGRKFHTFNYFILTLIITILFAGLIMLQPDLGTSLVFLTLWFGYMLLTGANKKFILIFVSLGVLVSIFSWFFLFKDYQKERLLTFINPTRDQFRSGYNVTQSIIAIGAGQFWGRGLGFGSQSQLHFLPEAQTDFIFSLISEELGFIGSALVLILYFLLLWRLSYLASQTNNDFASNVILGTLIVFFTQITLNIGAATGLLPVTGLTLPFLSYGGSSLLMNYFLIGIVLSLASTSKTSP